MTEQLPTKTMRTVHVNVKYEDEQFEWRQVQARDLKHAFEIARQLPRVVWVYETSYIPGGLVT